MEHAGTPRWRGDELKRVRLFDSANLNSFGSLLKTCPVKSLPQGRKLLEFGQSNDSIYLLLSGTLHVYLDGVHGDEPTFVLEGGESVGEMSVLDHQLASATVVAASDCRLLVIGEEVLWSLVDRSPVVARNLMRVLSQRLRTTNRVVSDSHRSQLEYRQHALTDAMTGLFNRRWLDDNFPLQLQGHVAANHPFCLLLVDIDHFKGYNDSHGHLAGDRAIQAVAEALRQNVRKSDLVVRFGGEEFLVLLPGADRAEGRRTAERLRRAVREMAITDHRGSPLPQVTVSVGLGELGADQSPKGLIDLADKALYRAKQKGRDSIAE